MNKIEFLAPINLRTTQMRRRNQIRNKQSKKGTRGITFSGWRYTLSLNKRMTPASSKTRAKAPASSRERATPIPSHASRSCEYPITSSPSLSSFRLSDSTFTRRISRFASANVIDSAEPLPPAPPLAEGGREPESEREEQKRMARGRDGGIERFAGRQPVVPSEPPRRVRKRERADEEEKRHIALVRRAMG